MSYPERLFDTGNVTLTAEGWWVLNPKSTFPLHVYGLDEPKVRKLKRGLEQGYALDRDAEEAIYSLISRSKTFHWHELELYKRDFVEPFAAALKQMQQASAEWRDLPATDEDDDEPRDRLNNAFASALIRDWGEAFRFAHGIGSADRRQQVDATVQLLVKTYVAGGTARDDRDRDLHPEILPWVIGWELRRPPHGCCHICRALPDVSPKHQVVTTPVHAGCSCVASGRMK
ncbi:MAG TPA: hypothetical protein VGQ76_04870 [Thermoanaerobaculia bacterium]|nr:hypothetical protein [Thermoanaerobaculia bacterium]